MSDFTSVFDEAGDSAEQAEARRAMAVAKEASKGTQQFLFLATDEADFGHRVALAEEHLFKAAVSAGVSPEDLVAEHRREFGLLMEAKRSVVAKPMVNDADHAVLDSEWRKSFDDLRAAGLEADADHPVAARYRAASDAVNHANRSRDHAIATGQTTAAARPTTCPDCGGARAVPAQGHESYHEVSNGQVRCPTCAGHGVVVPQQPDSDDRNAYERYGDVGDDFGDAGDLQDRHYGDDYLASLKTALAEGQDPLEWLEEDGAGQGQPEVAGGHTTDNQQTTVDENKTAVTRPF